MEAVIEAIAQGRIESQSELAARAVSLIRRDGPGYRLSASRARRIASRQDAVKIRVLTRRAGKAMRRCPFCDLELRAEGATDLYGKATQGGRMCPECGFRIDPGRRTPARYVFDLRW